MRPVPWAGGGFQGWILGALRRLGQELLYRADPDAVEERERNYGSSAGTCRSG